MFLTVFFCEKLKLTGFMSIALLIAITGSFGKFGMSKADNAKEKMKLVIVNIIDQSQTVTSSSEELSATLEEMSSNLENINKNTSNIVKNILEINSSTNELSSTMEEVNLGITQLASNSTESSQKAIESKEMATNIKEKGFNSKNDADKLYEEKQNNILNAIEQGKIVSEIGIIAKSIASMSEELNVKSKVVDSIV